MDDFITARWPDVAQTEVSAFPADVAEWHACPDHDGDDTVTTAVVTYRHLTVDPRTGEVKGSYEHAREVCGLCLPSTLAEIHYGRLQPVFVRVAVLAEVDAVAEVAA